MPITSPYLSKLPNIEYERAPGDGISAIVIASDKVPPNFPAHLWTEQAQRYRAFWDWFDGTALNIERGRTESGEVLLKYPLQINPIRAFSRKFASLLFGEIPDSPALLVKPVVKPRSSYFGTTPEDGAKDMADFLQAILLEVWEQSNARSIMMENATLSQFLGGCYFMTEFVQDREDLAIPVVVRLVKPDFVLPIWNPDNYYDLLESWMIFRISASMAEINYGVKTENRSQTPWMIYAEHWTRNGMSVTLDGAPLRKVVQHQFGETTVDYGNQPNPFGLVPFVYIPRLREGNFYGPSMVPDLEGITLEYNARMADLGDVIHSTADPKWFGRNVQGSPRMKQFDNGSWYTDLGTENPSIKNPPDIWREDPPQFSDTMTKFTEMLWKQMMHDGALSPIMLGLDESSQRSSLSLALKMLPSTQMARAQRNHWHEGLTQIACQILDMLAIKKVVIGGRLVPRDWRKQFQITQDWQPMIPRDREQQVNENVWLTGSGVRSRRLAVELDGNAPDVDDELKEIESDMRLMADIEAAGAIKQQQAKMALQSPLPGQTNSEG
jgi:hypothetical protein